MRAESPGFPLTFDVEGATVLLVGGGDDEDAARKQLVILFEAMGPADPRTVAARRRLSSLLFS